MKIFLTISAIAFFTGVVAFANVTPPEDTYSRALQQAKRVAAMENDHDLPSRAVWLGQRVAKSQEKLAFASKKVSKKKKRTTVQN